MIKIKNTSQEDILFARNGIVLKSGKEMLLDSSFFLEDLSDHLDSKKLIALDTNGKREYSNIEVGKFLQPLTLRAETPIFNDISANSLSDLQMSLLINTLYCVKQSDIAVKNCEFLAGHYYDAYICPYIIASAENLQNNNEGIELEISSSVSRVLDNWNNTKSVVLLTKGHTQKDVGKEVLFEAIPDKATDELVISQRFSSKKNWSQYSYISFEVNTTKKVRMGFGINGILMANQFVPAGQSTVRFNTRKMVLSALTSYEIFFFSEKDVVGDVTIGNMFGEKKVFFEEQGCFYTKNKPELFLKEVWACSQHETPSDSGFEIHISLDGGQNFAPLLHKEMWSWVPVENIDTSNEENVVYKIILKSSTDRESTPKLSRFASFCRG